MVSTGTGVAGFISMTEPSKLVEKAIGRPNAIWNSVQLQQLLGVTLRVVFAHVQVTTRNSASAYPDLMSYQQPP